MLRNYLKVAFKVLLRRKFYTFISLFGIAFTLVVLMTLTAMFDHMFSAAAPESNLPRILAINDAKLEGPHSTRTSSPGYGLLDQYARDLPFVEKLSISSSPSKAVSYLDGVKMETRLRRTDSDFWEIFDFEFLEGRAFDADDIASGGFVAVINETTRSRFFDGESALGRSIKLDEQSFRIVGVVRDVAPSRLYTFSEVWAPIETVRSTEYKSALVGGFRGIVLARSRADFPAIKSEFRSRLAEAQVPDPDQFETLESEANTKFEEIARAAFDTRFGGDAPVQQMRIAIVVVALLFMLLPAINLINLNLSRILERSSEIGVRKAFGASSRALIGQFLVESIVLTVVGGIIGFLLTVIVLGLINGSDVIPYASFSVNLRVFAVGMVLSVLFGIFSGVYPAWRMSRLHPVESIQGRA